VLLDDETRRERDELLALSSSAVDHGHLVAAVGEVDMANAPSLAEYLVQFANGDVILDLSAVTFIDSSGLHALVAAHKRLGLRGARLVLHGTSPYAQRVIEITGLDRYLDLDGVDPGGLDE
jgi:anti-anti-sigma factor